MLQVIRPIMSGLVGCIMKIRSKLIALLRSNHPVRKEIEDSMDIQLFDQMIRNKAFDPMDLYKLVCYVFDKCKQLGAPARDKGVDTKKTGIGGINAK